jgi:hypothetical protein
MSGSQVPDFAPSFNGKPQATVSMNHSRLRLAVKRLGFCKNSTPAEV